MYIVVQLTNNWASWRCSYQKLWYEPRSFLLSIWPSWNQILTRFLLPGCVVLLKVFGRLRLAANCWKFSAELKPAEAKLRGTTNTHTQRTQLCRVCGHGRGAVQYTAMGAERHIAQRALRLNLAATELSWLSVVSNGAASQYWVVAQLGYGVECYSSTPCTKIWEKCSSSAVTDFAPACCAACHRNLLLTKVLCWQHCTLQIIFMTK